MKKRLAIICFGFTKKNIRSQPWHMANGIATLAAAISYEVCVFTDCKVVGEYPFETKNIGKLFNKISASPELVESLETFNADVIMVFSGSHELLAVKRFHLPANKVYAVICNARFYWAEIRQLSMTDIFYEWRLLKKPILASLIPGSILKIGYKLSKLSGLVYVSQAAQERYSDLGLPIGEVILPAVDNAYMANTIPNKNKETSSKTICYFGPPLMLRGVDLVIDIFEKIKKKDKAYQLKLLIRDKGESYVKRNLKRLESRIEDSEFRQSINLQTDYLSSFQLKDALATVDIFLLPFKITVSDSPLVVIEASLMNKPVVSLKTPGVEEFITKLGGVCATKDNLDSEIIRLLAKRDNDNFTNDWIQWQQSAEPTLLRIFDEN